MYAAIASRAYRCPRGSAAYASGNDDGARPCLVGFESLSARSRTPWALSAASAFAIGLGSSMSTLWEKRTIPIYAHHDTFASTRRLPRPHSCAFPLSPLAFSSSIPLSTHPSFLSPTIESTHLIPHSTQCAHDTISHHHRQTTKAAAGTSSRRPPVFRSHGWFSRSCASACSHGTRRQ